MIEFSTTNEQVRSVLKASMKIFTGKVVAKKMAKTATVAVTRVIVHPVYKKRVKRIKKYQVHDENGTSVVGQIVHFVASKPYSKTKKWKLTDKKTARADNATKTTKVRKAGGDKKKAGGK